MTYQPKSYRKFLATSVAAAMVATVAAPMVLAEETTVFTDTESVNSWAGDAINYLVAKGAIEGIGDNKFDPTGDLTRGQAAKILALSLGLTVDMDADTNFEDAASHWSSPYIKAIQDTNADVISGYTDGTFRADGTITRQEMAKMTVLAYDLELEESAIVDFSDNNDWGKAYVEILASLGVVEGVSAGKFDPNGKVNRAQSVVFVHRAEVDSVRVDVEYNTPVVTSVSAINATQVEVKFNHGVTKASLFTNGVSGAFKVTNTAPAVLVTSIDGVSAGLITGSLSADGKTLTVTAANPLSKRYDVVVQNLKTTSGDAVSKYVDVHTFAGDTTAPTITGTERLSASQVKIKFSEPLKAYSTIDFKYADGTAATGVTGSVAAGGTDVVVTMAAGVTTNKAIVATFIGAQDQAGNLLTPNPATVSFTKGVKDGVAPAVSSVNVVNNKTVEVKFSEELLSAPAVTGFAGTLTYTKDSTDSTKWVIKSDTANSGLKSFGVTAGYEDMSGETGAAYSKVVNFDVDTTAPKVASSSVTTVNGAEYLQVTFTEDVETEASLVNIEVTGTVVKNFITDSITTVTLAAANFVQDSTNDKVYRVALADLLGANDTKGASYSLTLTGKTITPATVELVDDIDGNAGPSAIKVSVVRNEDGTPPSTTKATLDATLDANGILVNADKTITVRFTTELDGASAVNVNNYQFDGAIVESAALSPYAGGVQDVTLTLKDGSNMFTGVRNVTIGGVKAKNALAMDTVYTTENLTENVAPTVSSATLTAPGTIKLTFTEGVYNATDATGGDFDLYVGGTKVTATTLDTEDVVKGSEQSTLTLIITGTALTAADLANGLSIKATSASTLDIKDANDNVLSVGTVTVQ